MSYTKKTTHVIEGLASFISQFKDKAKQAATLVAMLNQIQALEDVFSDLLTETTIENAFGIHLDNIGALVNEARGGRTDEQYREAINARIGLNTSEGTIEDIIELALATAGVQIAISIQEFFPAAFIATIVDPIDLEVTDPARMAAFIGEGKPSGVRGILQFSVATAFAFDGPDGTGYDEGKYGTAIET